MSVLLPVDYAAFHDECDALDGVDVLQRVSGDGDYIG
jgi:hypothetical protein